MKVLDVIFRSWYYLQLGWQMYFSIIFAFINIITVLYAFVISDLVILQNVFPSYATFAIFISIVIPILCVIFGYKHIKSRARRAEVDIRYEVDPYQIRRTVNSQLILESHLILNKLILKKKNSEKLTSDEYNSFSHEIETMKNVLGSRTMLNKVDLSYMKTETGEN
jgi:hypothetical protein|tara:strand:+ start:602 stop:1099 length:498 start_codon:yes stop_codon:yes gene_type:complete